MIVNKVRALVGRWAGGERERSAPFETEVLFMRSRCVTKITRRHGLTVLIGASVVSAIGAAHGCGEVTAQESISESAPEGYQQFGPNFGVYRPGGTTVRTTAAVLGTRDYAEHEEQELYQDARTGMDRYLFRIPNGRYRVHLKFAEIEKDAVGQRVFGIKLQGEPVVDRLDIFAEVGRNRAYMIFSQYVHVTDGLLRLDFVPIVDAPLVSAISVGGDMDGHPLGGYFQHLNCGGPQFRGYDPEASDSIR